MANQLSINLKQQAVVNSKDSLHWEDLDSKDRQIVMAVCFAGSPEEARAALKLSIGGFYKRWKYLKPVYTSLLDNLPSQAISLLKGYSSKAAETLGRNLEAQNASDQIKAANSILDRVTPPREQVQNGTYRKLTLEEFISEEN